MEPFTLALAPTGTRGTTDHLSAWPRGCGCGAPHQPRLGAPNQPPPVSSAASTTNERGLSYDRPVWSRLASATTRLLLPLTYFVLPSTFLLRLPSYIDYLFLHRLPSTFRDDEDKAANTSSSLRKHPGHTAISSTPCSSKRVLGMRGLCSVWSLIRFPYLRNAVCGIHAMCGGFTRAAPARAISASWHTPLGASRRSTGHGTGSLTGTVHFQTPH